MLSVELALAFLVQHDTRKMTEKDKPGCKHSIWHAKKRCEEVFKMKPIKEKMKGGKKKW